MTDQQAAKPGERELWEGWRFHEKADGTIEIAQDNLGICFWVDPELQDFDAEGFVEMLNMWRVGFRPSHPAPPEQESKHQHNPIDVMGPLTMCAACGAQQLTDGSWKASPPTPAEGEWHSLAGGILCNCEGGFKRHRELGLAGLEDDHSHFVYPDRVPELVNTLQQALAEAERSAEYNGELMIEVAACADAAEAELTATKQALEEAVAQAERTDFAWQNWANSRTQTDAEKLKAAEAELLATKQALEDVRAKYDAAIRQTVSDNRVLYEQRDEISGLRTKAGLLEQRTAEAGRAAVGAITEIDRLDKRAEAAEAEARTWRERAERYQTSLLRIAAIETHSVDVGIAKDIARAALEEETKCRFAKARDEWQKRAEAAEAELERLRPLAALAEWLTERVRVVKRPAPPDEEGRHYYWEMQFIGPCDPVWVENMDAETLLYDCLIEHHPSDAREEPK